MPTLTQNLSFVLLGEDRSASKAMDGTASTAERVTQKIGGAFNKLSGVVGGEVGGLLAQVGSGLDQLGDRATAKMLMVGGAVATGLGVALLNFASGDKQATDQLKAAVGATGQAWGDYADQVDAVIAVQQDFGHEGEDTTKALSILTLATDDTSKALDNMQLVADLAAAKHTSLEEAAGLVAKILGGAGGRTLKQYGIDMEKNAGGTANVEKALSQLAAKLNGQASASVDNFGSQVNVARVKITDWAQSIAGPLGTALTAIGPVMTITGVILDVVKTKQNAAVVASLAATVATEAQTVATVGLNAAMEVSPVGLGIALAGLAAVFATGLVLGGMKDLTQATSDYTTALQGSTEELNINLRAVAAKHLLDSGALEAATALGISTTTLVSATLGDADAKAQVTEKTTAMTAAMDAAKQATDGSAAAAAALDAKNIAAIDNIRLIDGAIGDESEALQQARTDHDLLSGAVDTTKEKMALAWQQANDYSEALRNIPGEVNTSINTYRRSYAENGSAYMATGGIVTRPTNALIGESGPEAVIPLNAGRLPLAGGGAGLTVNLYPQGLVMGTPTELAKQMLTVFTNAKRSGAFSGAEFGRLSS